MSPILRPTINVKGKPFSGVVVEVTVRIGELAGKAGVSTRSLRYYEEQGLLASTRSASGQRTYVGSDVERVRFLQCLYAAGLSSRAIAELLPCVDAPGTDTSDQALTRMLQERERIADRIEDLLRTRDALDQLIAAHHRYRESGTCCVPAPPEGD